MYYLCLHLQLPRHADAARVTAARTDYPGLNDSYTDAEGKVHHHPEIAIATGELARQLTELVSGSDQLPPRFLPWYQ